MQSISSDALSSILDYLPEQDVKVLFMAGSKRMRALLAQTVTSTSSLDIIGSSLANVKILDRVFIDDETTIPKSITHINILLSDLDPVDIVLKLPSNLTHVVLTNWTGDDLKLLPKTLTHLKLTLDDDFLPTPSLTVENIYIFELQVPKDLTSLVLRNVASLALSCEEYRPILYVSCDKHLRELDSVSCPVDITDVTELIPMSANLERINAGVYSPTENEPNRLSLMRKCNTLYIRCCNVPHTYTFPSTLTDVDLGVVNWYVPGLLPDSVTSLSCSVYCGEPDDADTFYTHLIANYKPALKDSRKNKVQRIIKFPPKLQELSVAFLASNFDLLTIVEKVKNDNKQDVAIDTLPTTLTYIQIVFSKNLLCKDEIMTKLMHDIAKCTNLSKLYVDVGVKLSKFRVDRNSEFLGGSNYSTYDMLTFNLQHLSKLILLHAPLILGLQNLPSSLKYLQCDELHDTGEENECKPAHVEVNCMTEMMYQWMKSAYIDVVVRRHEMIKMSRRPDKNDVQES